MRACLATAAVAMFAVSQAMAADIAGRLPHEKGQFDREVTISGEIVKGDSDKFHMAVSGSSHPIILMNSPGGDLFEGLAIGKDIRTLTHFILRAGGHFGKRQPCEFTLGGSATGPPALA
jgi:hypothetical protein